MNPHALPESGLAQTGFDQEVAFILALAEASEESFEMRSIRDLIDALRDPVEFTTVMVTGGTEDAWAS